MGYYKINQLKMPLDHKDETIRETLRKQYGFQGEVSFDITKKSVDARKKDSVQIVYNVNVYSPKVASKKLAPIAYVEHAPVYERPELRAQAVQRPVIIGAGPAGLFAGLILAEAGAKPIVLERGQAVDERHATVGRFFETGDLDPESNIQFGEGGAGTYSDGKINTGVKDKHHRIQKIVETFVWAGAPEEIRYMSKPHIGTDYLIEVVKNMRLRIIELGGEVRFNTKVTSLLVEDQSVKGVQLSDGSNLLSGYVILAIGHSARDTFSMLADMKVPMEKKAFAIGLRIEHPQAMIGESQFGKHWNHPHLPVADYKLTYRTGEGRAVYSFCMCPGGFVVNSASEPGRLVCNGMSNFSRDEVNANSALLVNVHTEDFDEDNLLAGVSFQRKWEERAFVVGGGDYHLPVQTYGDFCKNQPSKALGDVIPNIKGHYRLADLNGCLPLFVTEAIKEGVEAFGRVIKGFNREDAVLTGVETRSSSPVRILRDDAFESDIGGLYPCGEGAGYAGGIMSAAIDGIKVAEAVINHMNCQQET